MFDLLRLSFMLPLLKSKRIISMKTGAIEIEKISIKGHMITEKINKLKPLDLRL